MLNQQQQNSIKNSQATNSNQSNNNSSSNSSNNNNNNSNNINININNNQQTPQQHQQQNNMQLSSQQQQYTNEQIEMQTAQFIKTNTLINNNPNNGFNNLQNSQQSSTNQQKKNTQSSVPKKNSTGKEPMTLSINHMIMQNQSICQGINEESMDKSYLSQGIQNQNQQAQRMNEKFYFKKKIEKDRYKESLRSSNILFIAALIIIFQADSIYIFSKNSTENNDNQNNNNASKILFIFLVIFQIIVAILFVLLGFKSNQFFKQFIKQRQIHLGIANIIIQIAYFESVLISLQIQTIRDSEFNDLQIKSLTLIPFRLLNIFIYSNSFQLMFKNSRIKNFTQFIQILYFSIRFFYLRLNYNYIEIAVIIVSSIGLKYFFKIANNHEGIKKNIQLSSKFQRLLNQNNQNNAYSHNNTIIVPNGNNLNFIAGNVQNSIKGSPPEKNVDEILEQLKQQSFNINNNNNISMQGSQGIYPFIFSSQQNQLQKQQSLNLNMNTQNSCNKNPNENNNNNMQILNTNNNQALSYNSLSSSFMNLEKPLENAQNNNLQQNYVNKRSQFGVHSNQTQSSNQLIQQQDFYHPNYPNCQILFNNNINQIKASEKQHQMSKISELDLENDFSKHNNNQSQQNQNMYQNGLSTIEQKSLMDQLIEIDGVLVFEQETQYVVFANQNILNLLETDVNRVLSDIMQLKQVQLSSEDRTQTNNDYSTSNLLKYLFKDNSMNPLINSPMILSANNTSKASNKIGSNTLLNRVIEVENENENSPQIIRKESSNNKDQNSKPNEQQNEFNFSEKAVEELIKQEEQKQHQVMPQQQQSQMSQKGIKSLIQNNSLLIPRQKKENYNYIKSRSHNYKASPSYLTPNAELTPEEDEDNEKRRNIRNESIFKKLSPQFNSSSDQIPNQQGSNTELNIQLQNNEPISFVQNRHKGESLDYQFPSFISSISHLPRKSTINQNSFNTIERDRNNTLKDFMDDVRSKSGTFLAQHRKSTITVRKKTLNSKKQISYSQQPETIINNMVLFKENTSKIYLLKYSIVEHAGKILHIISIRDLSNEVFEQILDRQNSVLIDELYKYLNFTEISQILNKSVKQMKDLKYKIQLPDYKSMIQPIKLNLKLFKYLMNDIYDIRSLQHRNFLLNKDYFDLQQELLIIKKMTENLRNDILFNFYYDKLIPIQILNDKERITQILMNLLVNCYKVVKNNKIFLKAKMCKEQNFVKIIIQNRELNKTQKEQILKAFTNQTNSLGYHFLISNLLAQQVSNQKYKLEVISNKQEYVKFKFHIHLFTHSNNDYSSPVQLIKPSLSSNPQQGRTLSQNTISTNEKKNDSQQNQQLYLNSLSHLDLDENDQEVIEQQKLTNNNNNNDDNQINNISPPTHLDKGQINTSNLIKDSKTISNSSKLNSINTQNNHQNLNNNNNNNNKIDDQLNNESQNNNKNKNKIDEFTDSQKTLSNFGTEMSEQVENAKIKDFNNIQEYYPMKFIADLKTSS